MLPTFPKRTNSFPKELETTLKSSETQEPPDPTRNSPKVMFTTEEVEPAESNIYNYFSDGPRKEGGGRGNVGNLKDIYHKEKYERPV